MPAPNYLLGKDLTSISVYTGTRNATTGAMTWSGVASVIPGGPGGSIDYFRVSDQRLLEMITAVNSTFAHYEKLLNDSSLTIGEILRRSGNVLQQLSQTSDYLKVVIVTAAGTYTYYGVIRDFNDGVSAFGKNTQEITLAPFHDGTNVPLSFVAAS